MSHSARPAHAVPIFTSESVLLAPRPPGHAHTPRRSISDGLHPGWSWLLLHGLNSPLLCRAGLPGLAGPRCAGKTEYGHRPSLGSTDPHYQLPSSSYFCILPFHCCAASLLSCLFLEPADIHLLIQANALRIRKVRTFFGCVVLSKYKILALPNCTTHTPTRHHWCNTSCIPVHIHTRTFAFS